MAKSLKRKRKDIPIKDSLELDKMMETILIVMYIQEDLVVSSKKLQELEIVFQNFTNLKKSVILVLIGPYGCGKTASAVLLGKKYNLNCVFWRSQDIIQAESEDNYSLSYTNQLLNFLNQQTSIKKTLKIPGCPQRPSSDVLIIDSLPNLYDDNQKLNFQSCIKKVLLALSKLIIFVMSDYSINQIPNIFGAESSQFIKIIQFREIGKRAIVKALRKTNQELEAKNVDFDEIAETSNGSIRTALNKLSLLKLDNSSKKNSQLSEDEDIKLSFFHGLGKFMYNKRIDVTGKFRAMSYEELWDRENRPKLSFDPDEVISKCPCEPSFFWLYLYENFIWFYDDIEDLAEAYETFQTADLFSTSHYTTSNTNSEYIPAQLCGRAVVDSNLHPAKTGFFNFKKPQIFKLHKTIQESTQNLRTLKRKEIIENGFRFDEFLLDVVSFNRNSVLTKRVEEEIQEENTTRYWENVNSLENN